MEDLFGDVDAKPEVARSVSFRQNDIIWWIVNLHTPIGFECDVTYGNGLFYQVIARPRFAFDIDPQSPLVIKASSNALPLPDLSMRSAVFDPPFLTYVKEGREHGGDKKGIMSSRFGGYWRYEELVDHYRSTMVEVNRILARDGVFVIKCQDVIHNHLLHPTHTLVYDTAAELNLEMVDLFILCANHRLPVNASGLQQHSRIHHSYFMVFKKTMKKRHFKAYQVDGAMAVQ